MVRHSKLRRWILLLGLTILSIGAAVRGGEEPDEFEALEKLPDAETLRQNLEMILSWPRRHRNEWLWKLANNPARDELRGPFSAWITESHGKIPKDSRGLAAITAGRLEAKAALPVLLTWLEEAKSSRRGEDIPCTREAILYGLGDLGDTRATAPLEAHAKHADEWTRFFAREALAKINGQQEETEPRWPGVRGLRVMAVGRAVWGNAETDYYYQTLVRETFQGTYASHGLAAVIYGSMGGWRGNRLKGFLEGLSFDDEGRPRYDVVIIHGLYVNETSPEFFWRLYHYARRGARVVIDESCPFWPRVQREIKGFTARGGVITGKIIRRFFYERGPWDALFPERLEHFPTFPSLDGLPSSVKTLYYGYRPIGRGGALLASCSGRTFKTCVSSGGAGRTGFEPSTLEPHTRTAVAGTGEFWPQILSWLAEGPSWRPATIDWRDEPAEVPVLQAGRAFAMEVAVSSHAAPGALTATVALLDPTGKLHCEKRITLAPRPGAHEVLTLDLTPDGLAEPGSYCMAFSVLNEKGDRLHKVERPVEMAGRFDLSVEAPPLVPAGGIDATVKLAIVDKGSGPIRDGQLRLALVNEDLGRTYLAWKRSWDGPRAKESVEEMRIRLPGNLPAAQYALVGSVGDAAGRTFARASAPIARQERYCDRHAFLWSEWGNYDQMGGGERRLRLGLNATYGYGGWHPYDGFAYEYAVINPPQYTWGDSLGDIYLGRSRHGAHQRNEWVKYAQRSLHNARAMSVNLIEEVQLADESRGWGRRTQFRRFLQDVVGTTAALNKRTGSDIHAWDELPFASVDGAKGIKELAGWFHYYYRDNILHMRGDWLREANPYVHIEPGMGAGLRSSFYDGMHMRGYTHNNMLWFPKYRLLSLPTFGREPMTWLVGMRWAHRFPPQARVVWSAIAAGGRHMLIYAPGDKYGQRLFHPDGRFTPAGQAYHEVIRSVRPCEPVLGHVQNRISKNVCSYDWTHYGGGQGGFEPAVDALLRMGVQPDESKKVERFKLVVAEHGAVRDAEAEVAALRRALEQGAVFLATPGCPVALARGFGVRIPDPKKRGEAVAADLTPLSDLVPLVKGLTIRGKLGPAEGVEPDSSLTATPGLIFGKVGEGLFLYVNVASETVGGYYGDQIPLDLLAWTRLMEGLLSRVGVTPPFNAVDTVGEPDPRLACHLLDTEDGTQRYLMVQANDVLEGSLSAWGLEQRVREAYVQFDFDQPKTFASPEDTHSLSWKQASEQDGVVWVRRRAEATPARQERALKFFLRRKQDPPPKPPKPKKGRKPAAPAPTGQVRAFQAPSQWAWEAAGPDLHLREGDYELRLVGTGRSIQVDRVAVLPAAVTARVRLNDNQIRAVFDVGRRVQRPVVEEDGARFVDVPLRAGEGAVLSLIEEPESRVDLRPQCDSVPAGSAVAVEATLLGPGGERVRKSHTLLARLVGKDGQPLPGTETKVLLTEGRSVFDFWVARSDPAGEHRLETLDLTTGRVSRTPLTVEEPGKPKWWLEAEWKLHGLPVRGGTVNGSIALRNRTPKDVRLDDLSIISGTGVIAEMNAEALVLHQGKERQAAFTLTIARDAEIGRTVLRLVSGDKGVVWGVPGYVVNVPPPCELIVNPLPDLREPDVAVFQLSGRVRNRTPEPLALEISTNLPENAFPGGAASRRVQAPPGVWQTFSVPVVLTRQTARRARDRRLTIPVWLADEDGSILARQRVQLLTNPWDTEPGVIMSLGEGRATKLNVLNATEESQRLQLDMQPVEGLGLGRGRETVGVAPQTTTTVRLSYHIADAPPSDGVYQLPYTITMGQAVAQPGETRVEVRTETRWWISVRSLIPEAPKAKLDTDPAAEGFEGDELALETLAGEDELIGPWAPTLEIFDVERPPADWKRFPCSGGVYLSSLRELSSSLVLAATRVDSPKATAVRIRVGRETGKYVWLDQEMLEDRRDMTERNKAVKPTRPPWFLGRVWLNGQVVYDSRPTQTTKKKGKARSPKEQAKEPIGQLKKGVNTLLVQCLLGEDLSRDPGTFFVFLQDPATGKRIKNLVMNMDMPLRRQTRPQP